MKHPHKAKTPALARGGFANTVSSALTDSRHSTRPHVGRKLVDGQCPVCNSRRFLSKSLSLSLGDIKVSASVCDACHSAAGISIAYSQTIAHRFAQHQHHKGVGHAG